MVTHLAFYQKPGVRFPLVVRFNMREFSYQCLDCNGSTLAFDEYKQEYFCVRCPFTLSKSKAEDLTKSDNTEYKIGFSTVYDYNGTTLILNLDKIKDPQLKRKLKKSQKKEKLRESISLDKAAERVAEKASRKSSRKSDKKENRSLLSSSITAVGKRVVTEDTPSTSHTEMSHKEMQAAIRKILAERKKTIRN